MDTYNNVRVAAPRNLGVRALASASPRLGLAFALLLVLFLGALSQKSAGAVVDYGHGEAGYDGFVHTIGFAPRNYNEVYFSNFEGAQWSLRYCNSDNTGGVPTSCNNWVSGSTSALLDYRTCSYCYAEAADWDYTHRRWTLVAG